MSTDDRPAPPTVETIDVHDLAGRLDGGDAIRVYDVRGPEERAFASIDRARPLDEPALDEIDALAKDAPLAFLCHHGMRSLAAAEYFARRGHTRVFNVAGGIDAWSREVDPGVPRY